VRRSRSWIVSLREDSFARRRRRNEYAYSVAGDVDPFGERKRALASFLEEKVREGFEIETHTDTHAIVVECRRRSIWGRLRGGAGERYVLQVDEHGGVTMTPAEPKRS
jgi:hypothetical protein